MARNFAEGGTRAAIFVVTSKAYGMHGKFTRIEFEGNHVTLSNKEKLPKPNAPKSREN
jgi:hypothetical protein